MNSKWKQLGMFASALVFFAGCGFQLTPFFTPVYKNPPGYSETYKKHLLGEPDEGSTTRTEKHKDGFIQNQPRDTPTVDKVHYSKESRDSGSSSRKM